MKLIKKLYQLLTASACLHALNFYHYVYRLVLVLQHLKNEIDLVDINVLQCNWMIYMMFMQKSHKKKLLLQKSAKFIELFDQHDQDIYIFQFFRSYTIVLVYSFRLFTKKSRKINYCFGLLHYTVVGEKNNTEIKDLICIFAFV